MNRRDWLHRAALFLAGAVALRRTVTDLDGAPASVEFGEVRVPCFASPTVATGEPLTFSDCTIVVDGNEGLPVRYVTLQFTPIADGS